MAINRYPRFYRDINAPVTQKSLHEHYVRAVNAALESGRDRDAQELAAAYADELAHPVIQQRAA